jgi:hypothetical protein
MRNEEIELMPSTLLEKPTTLEDAPQAATSRSGVTDRVQQEVRSAQSNIRETGVRKPLPLGGRIEALLRDIFKGREEFLGWIPD